MVRLRTYFLLLAVALLYATACSRMDEGDLDDTQSLALSLKNAGQGSEVPTKMTATITQDGAGFRGIEQVFVIPFQTASAGPAEAASPRLGDRNVVIQNPVIGPYGLVANNNSHLYNFVRIPLKTNRVLAYGKAADSGSASTKEGKHKNGVLTPSGLENPGTPGDISFSLEAVLEPDDRAAISNVADDLIAALNGVVEILQASEDAGIRALLDAFTAQNQILACSFRTLYQLNQTLLGAFSNYEFSESTAPAEIAAIIAKLSALQAARNAAGSNFPASYGIPEGSIGLWWNGHRFVKIIDGVNVALVPMDGYCYPPSLWYYANSPVKTSDDDEVEGQYKPQNASWNDILAYYTEGASVMSSTRSVAIVDQMQYGVGLVEFRFRNPGEAAVAAAECPLTGIIIGDQKNVGYDFAPLTSESRFVYDNTVSGITLGGTSQYFQVLVLPTAVEQTVHFALEFQNNTTSAFPCQQGTVQPGCKFYLAGELKPETIGTKPEGYTAGAFASDHKTTVYVKVNSLANAYNTVPDLRDPQLELGVVAEVDWVQLEPGGIKLPF